MPDHTDVKDQPQCSFSFSTDTITQTAAYSESLSVDASVSGEGWGASFSASFDYNSVKQQTSSHKSRYYSSKALCTVYSASINYQAATLSDDFISAVKQLSGLKAYRDIITMYGTHFVWDMKVGGRYGYRSEMTTDNLMELARQLHGIGASAAATYSGLFDVKGSLNSSSEENAAKAFNKARTGVEEYFVGGKAPKDKDWTPYKWAQSLATNPLPIQYNLISIDSLLTKSMFPNDPDIAKKKEQLHNAIVIYCKSLPGADTEACGKSSSSGSSLLKLSTVTDFNRVDGHEEDVPFATLSGPNMRISGVLQSCSRSPTASFVISDVISAPKEIVTNANGWTTIWVDNDSGSMTISANCPRGYASVSDFLCAGMEADQEAEDCVSKLPPILPCFAEDCLTECRLSNYYCDFLPQNWYYAFYEDGYPLLGANIQKSTTAFFRDIQGRLHKQLPTTGINKCLQMTCLNF